MQKETLFSTDWLELQKKYWESWTEMSRAATGREGADPTKPWESALDHWWQAMAPAAPGGAKDFMEKMIEQGKGFFRMAEAFMPAVGANDGYGSFMKTLDEMQARFSGNLGDGGDSMTRLMAFWEMPYDNWQRMVSSMSPMPGDALRNMPHDHMKGQMDRVLSAPGLGYTREEQSQYQDLMRRSMDYQKALQAYMGFFASLGVKSVERMRGNLQTLADGDKPVDSARAVYDNWVSCCESVYAEEVMTPEYAQIHGQLVNAQMGLKHRMAVMVDESLGAMNMPSRSELRTLQDRMQESRRENKRLRREMLTLKRQVQALADGNGPRPASLAAPVVASELASPVRAAPLTTKKAVVSQKAPVNPTAK